MQDGLYVSVSAQISRVHRLDTIASNLANSQTVGFRGSQIRFEEVVQEIDGTDTSFSSQGVEYVNTDGGGLEQTGNPLDFAVRGNAWFGIQTEVGTVVTRDGRFTMIENGNLVTLAGHSVLDPGGAPITLNPAGGVPELGSDGFIRQGGTQVAALGLFAFDPPPGFTRFGSSGIVVGGEPEAIIDDGSVGIVQGHLENSNVDPLHEITQMILVQRTFEQAASLLKTSEESMEQLIRAMSAA